MNVEFRELFGHEIRLIPLRDTGNVVCANAARVQWHDAYAGLARATRCTYSVIPLIKARSCRSLTRRLDFELYFGTPRYPRNLDYISLWFLKGADYVRQVGGTLGFVSTNRSAKAIMSRCCGRWCSPMELRFALPTNRFSGVIRPRDKLG